MAGCSVGLGDPPHYLINPPPESRRQSIREKQSLVRASRLIQSHPSPTTHNAPLHAFCQRIPVVVASVAEAEYAAAFGGGQVLPELSLTLANLGHPQQSPPPLFVDNECAIGLATSSVRPKKSKLIDMRLDWVKERVSQHFLRLVFLPGLINPSDFFTNVLPVSCISPHFTLPPSPSFTAPPTILKPYTLPPIPSQPHTPPTQHHLSPDSVVGTQRATGIHLPSHHLSFTTYLFLPFIFPLKMCIASNKPLPTPVSFPPLRRGSNASSNPGPAAGCWSFKSFLSCIILAFVLA